MSEETRQDWKRRKSLKMKKIKSEKSEEDMKSWTSKISESNREFWKSLPEEEKEARRNKLKEMAETGQSPRRRAQAGLRNLLIHHGNKIDWIATNYSISNIEVTKRIAPLILKENIFDLLIEEDYLRFINVKRIDTFTYQDFLEAKGRSQQYSTPFKTWKKILGIDWEEMVE